MARAQSDASVGSSSTLATDAKAKPKAKAGPRGPAGPAGKNGATGATGAAGATGPAGPTGPAGGVGPAGTVGAQGIQGIQGIQGVEGKKGEKGTTGFTKALPSGETETGTWTLSLSQEQVRCGSRSLCDSARQELEPARVHYVTFAEAAVRRQPNVRDLSKNPKPRQATSAFTQSLQA